MQEADPPVESLKEQQLWDAASEGRLEEVVSLATDPTVDVNWADPDRLRTPFYRACFHGHTSIVEFLQNLPQIEVNKVSRKRFSGFYAAGYYGHLDIIRLLLRDPRVNIELPIQKGHTPLWGASQEGRLDVVRLIVASDVDLDVEGRGKPESPRRSPKGVALWSLLHGRYDEDVEGDYERRLAECPQIVTLLEQYEEDRTGTRLATRMLPGVRGLSPLPSPSLSFLFFL